MGRCGRQSHLICENSGNAKNRLLKKNYRKDEYEKRDLWMA